MPKVQIKDYKVWVGDKGLSLVSGEVHYWRLNPSVWKEVLKRVKEMGIKIISTYVPWDYHEYKRGKFDFFGKTDETRNLNAFLELARKENFWVIIRPGPYIYSEWPQDGAPKYAYKYHRLHPQFLSYAKKYLTEVTRVIKPFLATNKNGNIIMLQADNEIDCWPDIFGCQYGLSGKSGMFQDFLKNLYKSNLKALNDSWGTKYSSFKEAAPFIATMLAGEQGVPLKGDKELKRNLDYFKFKYFYANEVAKWSVNVYKKLGIDVPIYLNTYPFYYAHDWAGLQSLSDAIGLDIYPSNELAEDEYEHRKFCDKIRYLKSVSKLPFIAEFQSGIWHGRHYETSVLTPNHYRLLCLSAILSDVKGWNWYMLVNRDNWYMSPINEWGRVRGELYDVFKQMVTVFEKIDPPTLKKQTEIAATFNPLQYAARTLSHNSPILSALYKADLDYELCDPRFEIPNKKVVFYSGNQWLSKVSQKNLRKYVESGGTIVAFRNYPRKNEDFKTCSLVGFEDPSRILFEFKRAFDVKLAPARPSVKVVSSVYSFDVKKGLQKIQSDFGNYGKITIGYIKKIGKGKIIHVGVEPTKELVSEILNFLKVSVAAHSTTSDIKTAIFERDGSYHLIVINNGNEDKSAMVYLPKLVKGDWIVKDILEGTKRVLPFERCNPLDVQVSRKDGKVLEISPKSSR